MAVKSAGIGSSSINEGSGFFHIEPIGRTSFEDNF